MRWTVCRSFVLIFPALARTRQSTDVHRFYSVTLKNVQTPSWTVDSGLATRKTAHKHLMWMRYEAICRNVTSPHLILATGPKCIYKAAISLKPYLAISWNQCVIIGESSWCPLLGSSGLPPAALQHSFGTTLHPLSRLLFLKEESHSALLGLNQLQLWNWRFSSYSSLSQEGKHGDAVWMWGRPERIARERNVMVVNGIELRRLGHKGWKSMAFALCQV